MNRIRVRMARAAAIAALVVWGAFGRGNSAQETQNQQLVLNWYREVIAFGHVDLAAKYMANGYVEHDPNIGGGNLAAFVKFYGSKPARPVQPALPKAPAQMFTKGDYVTLVWEHDDRDPKTSTPYKYFTYDVTRVKEGKIQEHWNNARLAP
jgi:predicted SnoaL-like aldol condensation-catalyzing enzyme